MMLGLRFCDSAAETTSASSWPPRPSSKRLGMPSLAARCAAAELPPLVGLLAPEEVPEFDTLPELDALEEPPPEELLAPEDDLTLLPATVNVATLLFQ